MQIIRRRNPEVLAPAGNMASFKAAVDFGADAVYMAGKIFGMRSRAKNFTPEQMQEAIRYAHARDVRVYITCNILPTNPEVDELPDYIDSVAQMGADALIVSDIGVMLTAKRVAPNLELHVSTQAGVVNYLTANELHNLGAKRVVLARELSLDAIKEIRAKTPKDLDIECFVHGSMCMAFSGRCLISEYMTGRDANHGDCAQSCRWKYSVMEEKRPGKYFPVEESDGGTYLFNSQDMNLIEHLDDLIEAGITSLKIEGRAKNAYYVATLTNAYKQATNLYLENPDSYKLPQWLTEEPYKVSHREYSTGFYYPEHRVAQQTERGGYVWDWNVVGDVISWSDGVLTFREHNKIEAGQAVEFLRPGQEPYRLKAVDLRDENGTPVLAANHPMSVFTMACPEEVGAQMMMRSPKPPLPSRTSVPAKAAEEQEPVK
ncbi:MAG: U32 family peptidase [Bifidobacteriaceae bacterium]|jgi:putative protease|nr:U32 family peptidase [Bifidobacteriaceae bacterium]MCI1914869.1 U32 family peptidase [Bifidobacteriaceae bacterium]